MASRRERGLANPMRALALMTVERALPLISPGYNLGVSEDEMRAQYRRFYEALWSESEDLKATPEYTVPQRPPRPFPFPPALPFPFPPLAALAPGAAAVVTPADPGPVDA
jgi:hypothetical protein